MEAGREDGGRTGGWRQAERMRQEERMEAGREDEGRQRV
jgi:hypothetical protein